MSRPANALAKFRSYSYHHILIACDNDAAAEFISGPRPLGAFTSIGSREPVTVDRIDDNGVVEKLNIGNYVVLLNGMIDTEFVVQSAEWFTATSASTDKRDRFNSIAVEGTMQIQEPRGIRFMNALNDAADKLQTDPTGIIWLLKTIFVGHRDNPSDGTVSTEHITNIKPLRFMLYDVTGTFDTTGGIYVMSFAGASNGASRFPQFSRGAEQVTITPQDESGTVSTTITSAMNSLATQMNILADDNRVCVVDALKKSYEGQYDVSPLDQLRTVNYKIVTEDYAEPKYVVDSWNSRQSDTGEEGTNAPITFGVSFTVEQAIRHIMDRSTAVRKDRTEGDENGVKYLYKIHSQISMDGQDDRGDSANDRTSNESVVLVKYWIRRFAQVTNQTVERVLRPANTESTEEREVSQSIIDQNTIEFDYFFSGANIDITEFDIKMEMGLAFLQALSTTNTLPTQAEQITAIGTAENFGIINAQENQGNSQNKGNVESEDETPKPPKIIIRNRTPVFPSTRIKDIGVRNAGNPKDGALFQAYLSRHAALENLEANITIAGNPYLMSSTNRQASDQSRKDNAQGDAADEENVLQNWETIPGLAKVNIWMPASNDTPSSTGRFDRERFWYTGYYYIYGITHKFDDGQFTQDIQLLSLPNESLVEETNNEETECGIPEKPTGDAAGQSGEGQTAGTANPDNSPTAGEATKAQMRLAELEASGQTGRAF